MVGRKIMRSKVLLVQLSDNIRWILSAGALYTLLLFPVSFLASISILSGGRLGGSCMSHADLFLQIGEVLAHELELLRVGVRVIGE
jgi:hypothetical protein